VADRERQTARFDGLARHYRWMEFVLAGKKLQRCRTAFLDRIAGACRVLLVGEGNGRFLVACRRALPRARITCVDASIAMLAQARRGLERESGGIERTEFVHADVRKWSAPKDAFDVIATHFFLDCFAQEELARVVARLASMSAPGGAWLLADFQIPESGLKHRRAQVIVWLMYRFFRVATKLSARALERPDAHLEHRGFHLRERREFEWGLLRSEWWEKREDSSDNSARDRV
jgi:ubiquinone/menaquinone biosynthesis C-methylase UbiE